MAKRKIKIVDVDDNYDDLKLQIQEPVQEKQELEPYVLKPVKKEKRVVVKKDKALLHDVAEQVKPVVEEVKPVVEEQPADVGQVKPVVEDDKPVENNLLQVAQVKPDSCHTAGPTRQKVRVQELMECPDCKKMITPKSFKYSHKKTCGITKTPEPVIESLPSKPKEKAKKEIPPEPQPEVVTIKPLTPEERRRHALKVREDKLTNLFMSTLKR